MPLKLKAVPPNDGGGEKKKKAQITENRTGNPHGKSLARTHYSNLSVVSLQVFWESCCHTGL